MILLKYLKMYFSDNTISILFPFVMKLSFLQKSEIGGGEASYLLPSTSQVDKNAYGESQIHPWRGRAAHTQT